jgi:hypothetical protein
MVTKGEKSILGIHLDFHSVLELVGWLVSQDLLKTNEITRPLRLVDTEGTRPLGRNKAKDMM